MSAIGLSGGPIERLRPRIISSHAEHRRSDFVFPRQQSLAMRDTPWGDRIKPLTSWSQIGTYGAVMLVATALLATLI